MSGITMNRHVIVSNKLLVAMSGVSTWTVRKDGYVYEKHRYHISDPYLAQTWSKSAIRQFLAYISLCNSEGLLHFVSEQDLSAMTGISLRTIQENNKQFQTNGILSFRRIWGEFLDIEIHNYKDEVRDLSISDDGAVSSKTGYTSIWHEVIQKLLSINNVNELRLALRSLLAFEKEVNVQNLDEAILSYDEIKGFLPSYVGYKKAIKDMVANLSDFLHITCLESTEVVRELFHRQTKKRPSLMDKLSKPFAVTVHLLTDLDSKEIKQRERNQTFVHWFEFKKAIRGIVPVDAAVVPQSDLHTFSDTYGTELVKDALERLSRLFKQEDMPVAAMMTLVEDFKANPSEFLNRSIHNLHLAKAIKN